LLGGSHLVAPFQGTFFISRTRAKATPASAMRHWWFWEHKNQLVERFVEFWNLEKEEG